MMGRSLELMMADWISAISISQAIEMYGRLSVENRSTHILPHNLAQIPPRMPSVFPVARPRAGHSIRRLAPCSIKPPSPTSPP
jgi:hypothetical protein